MTPLGIAHFTAAIFAVLIGIVIVFLPKGTARHRVVGRLYLIVMLVLNFLALSIYQDSQDGFGPFHYLSVASLVAISAGWLAGRAVLAKPSSIWSHAYFMAWSHAYFMAWSYAGLLTAAVGQLAVVLNMSVLWPILGSLLICGVAIHTQVRPAVMNTLGHPDN